ncbi:phenylacetic acid degradation operon negative regulatory protein [Paenibacillus forsythiae]|uniref:Phenylacetic acid degradation operon negative regulatory protein n=1 Tax=Paenibacillus forsythiae TaxID=365616 RepID=A0ABU3H8W1_9BACL|nr:hypothetical protein [Paenibacillus forsythiae]MDT3427272.1 phenylacetic acid degradation operon negative regulatory protein [Paenibacillus forsythiae]
MLSTEKQIVYLISCASVIEVGASFVQSFNQKPELSAKEWDRKWQLVTFEFPDGLRKRRQMFAFMRRIGSSLPPSSVYRKYVRL